MLKFSKKIKITLAIVIIALFLTSLPFIIYLYALPAGVSNPKVLSFVQNSLKKSMDLDLSIKNPILKTELSPILSFNVEELALSKNDDSLLCIKNFDTIISFSKVLDKKIVVKKLGADYIFVDVNKLSTLSTSKKESQKSDWSVDLFESLLYVKKCLIVFNADADTFVKINGQNIEITDTRNPKFVHFDMAIDITKNKENLRLAFADKDNVFIKDKKLFLENVSLGINNSKVLLSSVSDQQNNFDVNIFSKKFDIKNVVELLDSNLVIPNGGELIAFFKDIKGDFDFNINLSNKGMKGDVLLNRLSLKVALLNDLPMTLTSGKIALSANDAILKDFKGYYGSQRANQLAFDGTVKDYTKSCAANIEVSAIATNELSKNYISKVIGYPLSLVGTPKTRVIIKSLYNKMDIVWLFGLKKGQDILVDGASLSPTNYDRALKADMHLDGADLNIKSVNYYIASELNKNSKVKPILNVYGNMDIFKGTVYNLGFNIPKPLPSEFLNVLIGQKIFKKGTIEGNLQIINTGKYPVLDGNFAFKGVRIPSQRLSLKEAVLSTDKNEIHLNAFGRYKRSDYKLTGKILNEIKAPIVVKNINLTIDDIDIQRILTSFNNQDTTAVTDLNQAIASTPVQEPESDDEVTFNTGLLIVEECVLNVVKGVYKDIDFADVKATLTLDKDGILKVSSNRFEIAQGHSSAKIHCDLKNHKYSVILGVKDINSDIMATSLLDLKREISGKASGIISLNTDDSLRLNGFMKFAIKNGTIGKVGLVEYVLKVASLFRNPLAMISPSTLVDLVNVPEGNFDKISGDLQIKDNVVERIKIKSSASQLSSFIVGRFDLENRDATLRIYTKMTNKHKGVSGVLRNISLNSLANRVPLSSRNDSNYYSAELKELPDIEADEKDCQVFLTKVDGDVENNNFLSSLKRIK